MLLPEIAAAHLQLLLLHAPGAPGKVFQPRILLCVVPRAGRLRIPHGNLVSRNGVWDG